MIRTPARITLQKVATGILLLLVAIIIGASVYLNSLLPIITGYAAKNLCSAVFVSGREQAEVESSDMNFSFISYTKNRVDNTDMSVRSCFLWGRSKAIYRDGLDINSTALLPQWVDDGRSNISLNDLMHMQSGLEWNEDYGNRSDVTTSI